MDKACQVRLARAPALLLQWTKCIHYRLTSSDRVTYNDPAGKERTWESAERSVRLPIPLLTHIKPQQRPPSPHLPPYPFLQLTSPPRLDPPPKFPHRRRRHRSYPPQTNRARTPPPETIPPAHRQSNHRSPRRSRRCRRKPGGMCG